MNVDSVEKILRQMSNHADRIKVNWHGGEPLLLGLQSFEKVVEIQHSIEVETGAIFKNVIQTNATLIDSSWAKFFKEHDFQVGISLDGPQYIHDKNRHFLSGKGSFFAANRGLELLHEFDIPFGVLAVITRGSIGHEEAIFQFFTEKRINRFDFIPCLEIDFSRSDPGYVKLTPHSLEKGNLSQFMIKMYDLWIAHDDPTILIRSFEQILMGFLGRNPTLCSYNATCSEQFTIDHNGDIGPCSTLFARNLTGEPLTFGNMLMKPLDIILNNSPRQTFINTIDIPDDCKGCSYFHLCGGGCSKHRYMWSGNWKDKNYFCDDRKQIFRHIVETVKEDHPSLARLLT